MKLNTKFNLFLILILILSSAISYFVFYKVLMPEFDRQKEEGWSYRSQEIAKRFEMLLSQSLNTAKIITQSTDGKSPLGNTSLELFGQSFIQSLLVFENEETKPMVELHKGSRNLVPEISGVDGDYEYFLKDEILWVLARVGAFRIYIAFKIMDIMDIEDREPVSFLYYLQSGQQIFASKKGFLLEDSLTQKIKGQIKTAMTEYSPTHPDKLLVTSPVQAFSVGVGVFGENQTIRNTWQALSLQYLGVILVVVGITMIFSMLFIRIITKKLQELEAKSLQIGQGNFDVTLDTHGDDEVGQLAKTIKKMSNQIKELFLAKEKQLRMESELKVAQTVQTTLFPPQYTRTGKFEISGFYRSASECGGDLWGFWESEASLYLFILDATGHGVPAALITSASRAVAAIYETRNDLEIVEVAEGFNYAINRVGNNLQQATSFICKVDKRSGLVEYVNASHVSAYVLQSHIDNDFKVKDIKFIDEPISARLGEKPEVKLTKGSYQLARGETFILVTDGLFDMQTIDKKGWQEKRVLKEILTQMLDKQDETLNEFTDSLVNKVFSEHGQLELKDDVTLLSLRWK